MSNEQPGEYKQFRHRVVDDAMQKAFKSKPLTYEEQCIDKAKDITVALCKQIEPIIKAGGWKDKEALRQTICTLYLQAFDTLSKDELLNICTVIHTEILMDLIDQNPTGRDLLGG